MQSNDLDVGNKNNGFKVALVQNDQGEPTLVMDLDLDSFAKLIAAPPTAREDMARLWVSEGKARPRVYMEPAALGVKIDTQPRQPLNLVPVPRADALRAIQGRSAGLSVGDSYAVARLPRSIQNAEPHDRFVSLANLDGHNKNSDSVMGIFLVMAEIDDPNVFDAAEFGGMAAVQTIAYSHVEKLTKLIGLWLHPTGDCQAPWPFLVTYSGKKSFHCLWWIPNGVKKDEWEVLKKSKKAIFDAKEKVAAAGFPELLEIDPAPLFSGTALARIPCEIPEPGRFPQIAWRTGSTGALPKERLLEIAYKRIEGQEYLNGLKQIQAQIRSNDNGQTDRKNPELTDNMLISLGIKFKNRNGGGWLISCPTHEDNTPSAFVMPNGFVYCSSCCGTGRSYCARITQNGIEKTF